MKARFFVAAWLLVTTLCAAQALDQPVAKIKLDKKTALITQKGFNDQVAQVQAAGVKLDATAKKSLLDEMVVRELIRMDQEAQNIRATDDDLLKQFRANNPGLNDQQIRQRVEEQSGKSWDDAVVPLRKELANLKYFSQFPGYADLSKVNVTEDQIKAFYDANPAMFTAPDFVRVSHIFFDTKLKPKGSPEEVKKHALEILAKIRSGQLTFEEAAMQESDDVNSKKLGGDIGFIPRTTDSAAGQQLQQVFGQDFLTKLFQLKKGDLSDLMSSNVGFHIVRITQKVDKHFLQLSEPIYPGRDQTVSQTIGQTLAQREIAKKQAELIKSIGDNLKKRASIQIFQENL